MLVITTPAPFNKGAPLVFHHTDGWSAWGQFWHCVNHEISVRCSIGDELGTRAQAAFDGGNNLRTMDFHGRTSQQGYYVAANGNITPRR